MSLKNARKLNKSLTMRADSMLSLRQGKNNISCREKNFEVSPKLKRKLLKISREMYKAGFDVIMEGIEKESK